MSNTTSATADQLRSQAYGFLAAAMEYPEGELTDLIRAGELARKARELFPAIHPTLEKNIDWDALADAGQADSLSIEYTRLFDVGGADGPPCALNAGAIKGDARMSLLEELVRFYNYFGLTAAGTEANELPDHLSTQLEFMHYLIANELSVDEAENADDFIRAQRDFLVRHPISWIPNFNANLKKFKALPYYLALGELIEQFIVLEQNLLEDKVAKLPPPTPHEEAAEDESAYAAAQAQGMDAPTSSVVTFHRRTAKAH